ncbi:MAG: 4-hydroxy-tetrahydrodipicolinate synthase [Bacteroidota bacterium]
MNQLTGTGVALVTPFDNQGQIDYQGLKNLLDFTAEKGVDYYVVQGTTGESATTTAAEKAELLKFTKENNKHGLPIVFGIGGNNTAQIIENIKNTDFDGVTALLSASPYYNKPSQEGIYQHFTAIADACPVPVILYNVPGRTASNIQAETTLRLAQHSNIVAIKEAANDIVQAMHIAKNKPDDFLLISGDDQFTVPLLSIGASGVISVLANAFADIFKEMTTSAANNDFNAASKAIFKLLDINPLMYRESNPVGVKQVLAEMGVCGNFCRLPLLPASDALQKQIKAELDQLLAYK